MLAHPDALAGSLDPPTSGGRGGSRLSVSKLSPRFVNRSETGTYHYALVTEAGIGMHSLRSFTHRPARLIALYRAGSCTLKNRAKLGAGGPDDGLISNFNKTIYDLNGCLEPKRMTQRFKKELSVNNKE